MNYYNEFDPYAAQWLRNLIEAKLIPPGVVDDRSIRDVKPEDLFGFTQCHFFAGIAGWPLALKLAGWPEDREIWTGSAPCQPFSVAGKKKGIKDDRHLWPEFLRLIAVCRPQQIFGEQVASKDGRQWLSGVRADLERVGYGVGAADLCAAGISAPHIRQRLYWVADAEYTKRWPQCKENENSHGWNGSGRGCNVDGLGDTSGEPLRLGDSVQPGLERHSGNGSNGTESGRLESHKNGSVTQAGGDGGHDGLADATSQQLQVDQQRALRLDGEREAIRQADGEAGAIECGSNRKGPWSDCILIPCADGKARRIEPGIPPLAHGVPARVGKLRAYGNAIVPPLAAEFIKAYLEAMGSL